MSMMRNLVLTVLAAGLAIVITVSAFAASEFKGVWVVKGSTGKDFEITLSADGKATSTLDWKGTWKEEGGAAVISWISGWTVKITKEGDHYVKTSFKKGTPLDGPPTNTSDAVKK